MRNRWLIAFTFFSALLLRFSSAEAKSADPVDLLLQLRAHFKATDTAFIRVSNAIVISLLDSEQVDSAINIARFSLSLSERLHYKPGQAQSKFLLGKGYI